MFSAKMASSPERRPGREREPNSMKMELIQPFINAADAVLSQGLQGSTKVGNLTMEEQAYCRKGVAGMIALTGDIEGRIVLDLDPQTAVKVASHYAGAELPESDALIKETIFELANQVVGNAISALNDQGFHFRVHPPVLLTAQEGDKTSEDTEALMICFETSLGNVFMNVALRYNKRRLADHAAIGA
jgi:chemotaxis protein CheX